MIWRTRDYLLLALVPVVVLVGLGVYVYFFRQPALRVLCGSSMSQPVEEIQKLFEPEHGKVHVDLGGSETLLPRVLAGDNADIFVCHDPFEEKVREAGLLAGSVTVGVLRPVVLVSPGNPKGIASVDDLAREGIKLGIGDPRYSTCGQMFVDLLKRKRIYDEVMKNVLFEGRSHSEIANGLISGNLDAVVVWNFAALLDKDKTEIVVTDDEYPPVRVTVLGLKQSPHPERRDAMLEFCRTEKVQEIFARFGYK